MTGPSKHEQSVKVTEQGLGPPSFLDEARLFSPSNPPQHRIFVKALANLVQIRAQINHVQKISPRRPETRQSSASIKTLMDRANLKVLQRL